MDMALIILKQTLTMATYMAIGWCLFKCGKITLDGSKTLATLLMWLIIPVVVIRAFCVEFSMDKLVMLGQSFLLSATARLIPRRQRRQPQILLRMSGRAVWRRSANTQRSLITSN